MDHEVLTYLQNKIQQEIQITSENLGMGSSKSYDDYRYYCGIIRGLLIANNFVGEIKDRLEEMNG